MGGTSRADVTISADAHVGETEDLRDRLPEPLRRHVPVLIPAANGDVDIEVDGEIVPFSPDEVADLSDRDKELEFRSDPSRGTDLGRRMRDMAREDVRAQVVFPNVCLDCGGGQTPSEFAVALATAYNDFVWDVFSPEPKRFKPAAMLPVDDVGEAVAEAVRCIERGFATFFLPCVVPWQPYRLDVYEPLWSVVAEARVPLSFHVFSGNLALGGEFGDVADMSAERFEKARKAGAARRADAEQLDTVVGMAAGMAPIIELTGSGVLERHPDLRFVVTEADCGWLPWALQAMDQMQERRHLYRKKLPLRASEYFRRQGAITISDDEIALRNIESIGVDCLLWGNDYPHDEGTWPDSGPVIDAIRESLGPGRAHAVLCGNAARIYGFDLDYLAANRLELGDTRYETD
jgi:predicted TIM-barrel fold metal-dependent hydrolase